MRGLFALSCGVFLIGAMYFYFSANVKKDTPTLPIAYGAPNSAGVEMQFAVSMFLPKNDPPRLEHGVILWNEWMNEHFQLRDSSGAAAQLQRLGFSTMLTDRQTGGAPEFWVKAILKPGGTYEFDFTPILPGPKYRHTLTVPTTKVEPDWIMFEKYSE